MEAAHTPPSAAGLPEFITSKHIAVIAGRGGTGAASGTLSCRFGSETAIPSPQFQWETPGCFIRSRLARERIGHWCRPSGIKGCQHERFEIERIGGQAAHCLDGARAALAAKHFSSFPVARPAAAWNFRRPGSSGRSRKLCSVRALTIACSICSRWKLPALSNRVLRPQAPGSFALG